MLAIVTSLAASLARPRVATCPPLTYLNGVRPSGAFECRGGRESSDDAPPVPDVVIAGRVFCRPGEIGVVVDYRTAGCRRPS